MVKLVQGSRVDSSEGHRSDLVYGPSFLLRVKLRDVSTADFQTAREQLTGSEHRTAQRALADFNAYVASQPDRLAVLGKANKKEIHGSKLLIRGSELAFGVLPLKMCLILNSSPFYAAAPCVGVAGPAREVFSYQSQRAVARFCDCLRGFN